MRKQFEILRREIFRAGAAYLIAEEKPGAMKTGGDEIERFSR